MGEIDPPEFGPRIGQRLAQLARSRVIRDIDLVGKRTVVSEHRRAIGEVRQPLEGLAVGAEGKGRRSALALVVPMCESVGETVHRVTGLFGLDVESSERK